MADITVFGDGMSFFVPADTATVYSLKADSGFYRSVNYELDWTGSNLVYNNANTYQASGGVYTSFLLKDSHGASQIQVSNIAYAAQSGDVGFSAVISKLIAGNDNWTGTAANETFELDLGNDSFNGKDGMDTLEVSVLKSSDYSVTKVGTGYQLKVVTLGTGISGQVDTLTSIERIKFADEVIALDTDGVAGKVYRLYQAAFDRIPDKAGLGYWIGHLDQGIENLTQVAAGFVNSVEFKKLYGDNISDNAFLTALYSNVLHRAPDQAGFDYWNGRVSDGMSRAGILASFNESDENIAQVVGQMSHGIEFIPYG
ncbi:DUF4214 domain-containing protein [Undibacterium sp. TJN25]|uniref:DUF4214 domain-containing protein n=1 Tax=Undibacterium sp. TJN25 TaxID=3413056 RepID=UPI003BF0A224